MFPGVDGFHWTAQHIIFLALFFGVFAVIASTVAAAAVRSYAGIAARQVNRIRWRSEFHDLPERDRRCRRQIAAELTRRTCPNAFNCADCVEFQKARRNIGSDIGDTFGLDYRPNRLYHRGHTWVEPQEDGTALIGLDDLASRAIGDAEITSTPEVGSHLEANGIGWQLRCGSRTTRVLAPIGGEVVAVGGPEDWVLRVKPDTSDAPHLLRGSEVRAWVLDELERLQVLLTPVAHGAALADGGVIVKDLQQALPNADWDNVIGRLLLEP